MRLIIVTFRIAFVGVGFGNPFAPGTRKDRWSRAGRLLGVSAGRPRRIAAFVQQVEFAPHYLKIIDLIVEQREAVALWKEAPTVVAAGKKWCR